MHSFSRIHRFVQFAMSHAKTIEDYLAFSLIVIHSGMEITDQFYSVLNDDQIKNRVSSLGENDIKAENNQGLFREFEAFQKWKRSQSC